MNNTDTITLKDLTLDNIRLRDLIGDKPPHHTKRKRVMHMSRHIADE